MFANVFLMTFRERWRGWAIAVVSMVAMLYAAMWAYGNIDMSIYEHMPEAYLSLIGLTGNMDVGALSVSVIMGSYGAIVVGSMALTMGAASIAGEERKGTLSLLLANPRSRTHVQLSKVGALAVLTVSMVVAIAASIFLAASMLDVSLGDLKVWDFAVHLVAASLFYGMVSVCIGAWTGSRSAAVGTSVGLMVAGFLGTGLLPLIDGGEDWVGIFPWHYFDGADPLYNGVEWGDVGVLMAAVAVLGVAALVGVNRRDLKGQSTSVTMFDRLRANPMTKKVADKLGGAARVSSIWFKTASDYQTMLVIVCLYTFLVQGLMMGPFWSVIPEDVITAADTLPEEFIVIFGGGDMATPEGFYQVETFGMMGPVVVMILTISIAQGAAAGEESRRTMGLLMANPVSRSRVLAEKTFTMLALGALVGISTFAGVAAGFVIGGLDLNVGNLAATCVLMTLVGYLFGALALAIGAGTGKARAAMFAAIGLGVVTHVMDSLGELNASVGWMQKLSPYYYYLGSDPLNTGMDWGNAAVLLAVTVVLIGAAFVLFQRRDLRQGGE